MEQQWGVVKSLLLCLNEILDYINLAMDPIPRPHPIYRKLYNRKIEVFINKNKNNKNCNEKVKFLTLFKGESFYINY